MVASGWVHVDSLSHREASLGERSAETWCILLDESGVGASGLELWRSPESPASAHYSQKLRLLTPRPFLISCSLPPLSCAPATGSFPVFPITLSKCHCKLCNICLDLCQTGFLVSGRDFRSASRLSCSSGDCCAF